MSDYKIKISSSADLGAVSSARDVIDTLGSRTGAARDAFEGLSLAAKGNIGALFGVAKAARTMWEVFTMANPVVRIVTMIAAALAVAAKAFDVYRDKQKANAEASKANAEAIERVSDALAKVKRVELDFSGLVGDVKSLDDAYNHLAKSIDDAAKAQDEFGEAQMNRKISDIDKQEANAVRNINPDDKVGQAAVRASFQDDREYIMAEEKRNKLLRDRADALSKITAAQKVVQEAEKIKHDDTALERSKSAMDENEAKMNAAVEAVRSQPLKPKAKGEKEEGKSTEEKNAEKAIDQYKESRANYEKVLDLQVKSFANSSRIIDEKEREIGAQQKVLKLIDEQAAGLAEKLDASQATRESELDVLDVQIKQDELTKQQKDSETALREEREKSLKILRHAKKEQEAAAAQFKADEDEIISQLKEEVSLRGQIAAKAYARVMTPGAKEQQDSEAKAKAKEAQTWNQKQQWALRQGMTPFQLAKAEAADFLANRGQLGYTGSRATGSRGTGSRARGAFQRTTPVQDILAGRDAINAAGAAKNELDAAEREQALNIKAMKASMDSIDKKMDKALSLGGAQ